MEDPPLKGLRWHIILMAILIGLTTVVMLINEFPLWQVLVSGTLIPPFSYVVAGCYSHRVMKRKQRIKELEAAKAEREKAKASKRIAPLPKK